MTHMGGGHQQVAVTDPGGFGAERGVYSDVFAEDVGGPDHQLARLPGPVVALRPGVYEYQFILNGKQRVTDPTMPQTSSDFGSPNSVVTVSPKVPR